MSWVGVEMCSRQRRSAIERDMEIERDGWFAVLVTSKQERFRAAGLALFAVAVLNACGGGGSGGGDPVAPPRITTIAVSPSDLTLEALGATAQLEATARDQSGSTLSAQLSWGSSDTNVVTVNADGLVTAVNNGMATVTLPTVGASWTSDPDADLADLNARIVAVELFQGPMVWQWEIC